MEEGQRDGAFGPERPEVVISAWRLEEQSRIEDAGTARPDGVR
jgi:hypothetical protein